MELKNSRGLDGDPRRIWAYVLSGHIFLMKRGKDRRTPAELDSKVSKAQRGVCRRNFT